MAKMLGDSAFELGREVHVVSQSSSDPAARDRRFQSLDPSSLKAFFEENPDCATLIESEFVNFDQSDFQSRSFRENLFPGVDCLQRLRSKLEQKRIVAEIQFPQARWKELTGGGLSEIDSGFLKWSEFGYDGYGNFRIHQGHDQKALKVFVEAASRRQIPLFIEEEVIFDEELALVACRSRSDQFVFYPLASSLQKNHRCWQVRAPATAWGLPQEVEERAQKFAQDFARRTSLYGCFAVEFFYCREGHTLVFNEMAPRVHNSGHFTMLQAHASQFRNHLLALEGLPLQDFRLDRLYGMFNLLVPENQSGPCHWHSGINSPVGELYWYDKSELRPGRKMGHVNFSFDKSEEIEKAFDTLVQWESEFWEKRRIN